MESANHKLWNLDGKKFASVSISGNGEVDSRTIFNYYQKDAIIWATYQGGDIVFGVLSGYIENNQLIFSYQHQNLLGYIKTGKCLSTPKWVNNKLQLIEQWEWTCDDFSKGESILEEVD